MEKRIVQFIQKQTCATICCVDEQGKPWCFSCYYAFNPEEGLLYFKSSPGSHHATVIKRNPLIAGTILPDTLSKLQVKGVQFEGIVPEDSHLLLKEASGFYHNKYPIALAMPGEIFVIRIDRIKMTDSTLGFGKKISWNRLTEQLILN